MEVLRPITTHYSRFNRYGPLEALGSILAQNFDTVERSKAITQIGRLEWSYRVNDTFTLTSETGFLDVGYDAVRESDFGPLPISVTGDLEDIHSFEQDIQLSFDTPSVTGVVGLFYTDISRDQLNNPLIDVGGFTTGIPNGVLVNLDSVFDTENRNFAIYGKADIRADGIAPGLSFSIGARYDWEEFEFVSSREFTPSFHPAK